MQLQEQPPVLNQLSAELRAAALLEASATFAQRLRLGLPSYVSVLLVIWAATGYRHDHPLALVVTSAAMILGIGLRMSALSIRAKLFARSPETWQRLAGITIILLAGAMGFLLAHAMAVYGFVNWSFIITLIWNAGIICGSIVSFSSNSKLLVLQLSSLLLPPLLVSLFLHSSFSLQYAFANIALFLFCFTQGKQIGRDYWQQLVNRFLEDERRKEIETARHTAENALVVAEEARKKAEHAAKARSEFLANMSHEIRTPMNAVMGMTTLILDQDLAPETLDYVNTIRTSSDALLTIINDILDFSKIESGKLDLEHQPFCLYDCMEEVAELLANRAAEKKLELVVQTDQRVAEWIYGDITRTRQILLNLVGNAVKFTAQGEVVLSAELVRSDDSDWLRLAVRDTGIGIPADKIGSLFQSFTQVDASTTRRFGGTGLGLAISKRLVELMGGQIWVTSKEGAGSIFQLKIPYQPAPAQKLPSLAGKDWSGKRILVVDDNETNRGILGAFLHRWKLTPYLASSAKEALESLRKEHFDAVLLDLNMPDMDGADLALAIQQEWRNSAPPMIMLSSGASTAKEAFGERESPLAGMLMKPVRRQQLHRTLSQVLNGTSTVQTIKSQKLLDSDFAKRVPLRILLAEDNPVNQKVAIRMLDRLGYRADAVANGLEVLDALRRQIYDIVLMDVQMPEMNGLDATRHVIAEWGSERAWITALTAGAMKENRDECVAAGVDDFLTKPINPQELQAALERCARARNSGPHRRPKISPLEPIEA